jgi:DNA-binding response OmpR family regulator
MKILIVEDEKELRDSILSFLLEKGFVCECANDFHSAMDKIADFDYDVVLLDITLPDGNGLDILKELKAVQPAVGVLIISAKNSLDDKVNGLNYGADDYLPKPFHLSELNARVNAIIRRRNFQGNTKVVFNEIEIDPLAQSVAVNGHPLVLTKKELDLLAYLIVNRNRVLTKEAIAIHLWGDYIEMADNFDFIYTHVKNLRKKINEKGGQDYLKTVYGLGYKFTDR